MWILKLCCRVNCKGEFSHLLLFLPKFCKGELDSHLDLQIWQQNNWFTAKEPYWVGLESQTSALRSRKSCEPISNVWAIEALAKLENCTFLKEWRKQGDLHRRMRSYWQSCTRFAHYPLVVSHISSPSSRAHESLQSQLFKRLNSYTLKFDSFLWGAWHKKPKSWLLNAVFRSMMNDHVNNITSEKLKYF